MKKNLRSLVREICYRGTKLFPGKRENLRILCYHRIGDEASDALTVSVASFEKQMAFLSKEGYKTLPITDLINWIKQDGQLPERSVVITFDDGYQDNFHNAFSILMRYGHRAVFFPIVAFVGTDKTIPEYKNTHSGKIMDWGMVNEMDSAGMEFGSHGMHHPTLTEIDDNHILFELEESKKILEENLQKKIPSFCFPKGVFDENVISLLKKVGYELAFTTLVGANFKDTDSYRLRRTGIRPDDSVYDFKNRLEGGYDILVKLESWLSKRRLKVR